MLNNLKGYIKKLKEFLAKPPAGASPEDKKLKQAALRTNENIQVTVRCIFFVAPHYFLVSRPWFETCSTRLQSTRRPSASRLSRRQMQRTERRPRLPIPPRPERSESPSHSAALGEEEPGARRGNCTWTAWVNTTGNRKVRAQVSSYKPSKSARPSGHYAPPGGKFSGKIRDRRGSWNDNWWCWW